MYKGVAKEMATTAATAFYYCLHNNAARYATLPPTANAVSDYRLRGNKTNFVRLSITANAAIDYC